MRPLRAKRIDELLAERAHVRRARLPRDAARHARRRLRADSRDDSRRRRDATSASRRSRARARSRKRGTATPTSISPRFACCTRTTARCSSARSSRCSRRRSRPIRASSIAGRSPTRRCGGCSTSGPRIYLTSEHADWPAFLRQVLLDTLDEIERDGALDAEWGEVNVLDVAHPFAGSLGPLARRLRLPRAPLPGSMVSLRVAAPSYGAVLRMAVAPGAPETGVLQLAGGQSGHFLSPQFRDQPAGLGRRHADAVSRRRARHALRAASRSATETRRARSSAAPRRRSAGARPRSRRRRWPPSSLGRSATRRRRAAPTSSCRCC